MPKGQVTIVELPRLEKKELQPLSAKDLGVGERKAA